MLKRYLLSELTRVFGKYVDGLDDESLQVGVWSGKIELRDLELRPEALADLQLPIQVTRGTVRKLSNRSRCARCGKVGHWARTCTNEPDEYAKAGATITSGPPSIGMMRSPDSSSSGSSGGEGRGLGPG